MYQLMAKENVSFALRSQPDMLLDTVESCELRMESERIYLMENEYHRFLFDMLQALYVDEEVRVAIEPKDMTRYAYCISTPPLACNALASVLYHDCTNDKLLALPMELMSPNEIGDMVSRNAPLAIYTTHRHLVAELHNAICNLQHVACFEVLQDQYEPMFYSFKRREILYA